MNNQRLITPLLLLATVVMSAQTVVSDNWTTPFLDDEQPVLVTSSPRHSSPAPRSPLPAPRHSADNHVYYQRPEGAFYQGVVGTVWGFYAVTKIVVAPWQDVTYKNMCADPAAATWNIEGEAVEADANGDFTERFEPLPDGYIDRYLPTIEQDETSYTLGESNQNWQRYGGSIAWVDSVIELSVYDPGRIIGTNGGSVITNFRPLSMSSAYKYNYGTFEFASGGYTYYSRGVRQYFERPMSRLWVDNVTVPAISYSDVPMADETQLTLTLSRVERDEEGRRSVGETLATMTCTPADLLPIGTQTVSGSTVRLFTLVFNRDDLSEPLLLDDEFVVEIEGFQQEGIDVGLAAALIDPCDQALCPGSEILLLDVFKDEIGATLNYSNRVPCIGIRGFYDGLRLVSSGTALSLEAPCEGGQCAVAGNPRQTTVELKTAIAWNADGPRPNYEIVGLPSWLHVSVDESRRYFNGNGYGHGLVRLSLTAEANPEVGESRTAELYVVGRGVQTDAPIVVTQAGQPLPDAVCVDEWRADDGLPASVFSAAGVPLRTTNRGLNIVRRADGTVRKVVAK